MLNEWMRRGVAKVKNERKAPEATTTAMLPVEERVYSTGWQARPIKHNH